MMICSPTRNASGITPCCITKIDHALIPVDANRQHGNDENQQDAGGWPKPMAENEFVEGNRGMTDARTK